MEEKQYSPQELALLTSVLPNVAAELRGTMANMYTAFSRLVPVEARENDQKMDLNAAYFLQSYYRMHRVIGNLTDAAELAKTSRFVLLNDDIIGLARSVCERSEMLFDAEGVTLIFESTRAGQVIAMESALMERLLLNLLSNALKFTPRGGTVTVRVRVTESQVFLSVSDTGKGIAPDKWDHLFSRFLVTDAMNPPPEGMGLGLALCRRIAQGHGGSIVAESPEGKGATFTVSLPNVRSEVIRFCEPKFVYGGGFNPTLLQLSDALGAEAFTCRYMD